MEQGPSQLNYLGELSTLKNAIACWFYQGALDDDTGLPQLFAEIRAAHDSESSKLLAAQLRRVLEGSTQEMEALWAEYSGYGPLNSGGAEDFFRLFLKMVEAPDHGA
jgi:hypothetical protein